MTPVHALLGYFLNQVCNQQLGMAPCFDGLIGSALRGGGGIVREFTTKRNHALFAVRIVTVPAHVRGLGTGPGDTFTKRFKRSTRHPSIILCCATSGIHNHHIYAGCPHSLDERDSSLDHSVVGLIVVPEVVLPSAVQSVTA